MENKLKMVGSVIVIVPGSSELNASVNQCQTNIPQSYFPSCFFSFFSFYVYFLKHLSKIFLQRRMVVKG